MLLLLAVMAGSPALAADVNVAAAANFTKAAEELGAAFTAQTLYSVDYSFGATGALYTQISQGAPFEVFLAADDSRPARAVTEGLAVAGTAFTYAIGKLVLYSPDIDVSDGADVLAGGAFAHLAVADALTAPYGAAAQEVLARLGLTDALADRLVTGNSISQTLQFVQSGNAELGFVALSQVIGEPPVRVWAVPSDLYAPIRQDAVLLSEGAGNPAAEAFVTFLKSDAARQIMARYGYGAE